MIRTCRLSRQIEGFYEAFRFPRGCESNVRCNVQELPTSTTIEMLLACLALKPAHLTSAILCHSANASGVTYSRIGMCLLLGRRYCPNVTTSHPIDRKSRRVASTSAGVSPTPSIKEVLVRTCNRPIDTRVGEQRSNIITCGDMTGLLSQSCDYDGIVFVCWLYIAFEEGEGYR